MKQVLILLFCLTTVYSAVYLEEAPVSEKEKEEGYSCKSSNANLGLMKNGETRTNYEPKVCASATCGNGFISYATCGAATMYGCELIKDSEKPYPDCCVDFKCP